jgi:hypothetical protein
MTAIDVGMLIIAGQGAGIGALFIYCGNATKSRLVAFLGAALVVQSCVLIGEVLSLWPL